MSVTVYRLTGTKYGRRELLARRDDAIPWTPLFPTFELPPVRVFELPEGLTTG